MNAGSRLHRKRLEKRERGRKLSCQSHCARVHLEGRRSKGNERRRRDGKMGKMSKITSEWVTRRGEGKRRRQEKKATETG